MVFITSGINYHYKKINDSKRASKPVDEPEQKPTQKAVTIEEPAQTIPEVTKPLNLEVFNSNAKVLEEPTEEEKREERNNKILELHRKKVPQNKIAEELKTSTTTVNRIIKNAKK